MEVRQPKIVIGRRDHQLLSAALAAGRSNPEGRKLLAGEVARARVVFDDELPGDAVRLNSWVQYLDYANLEVAETRVVLPRHGRRCGNTSVASELGAALIGLRVGATMEWLSGDEEVRQITVTRLLQGPSGPRR